jgi:hypothetical protein
MVLNQQVLLICCSLDNYVVTVTNEYDHRFNPKLYVRKIGRMIS